MAGVTIIGEDKAARWFRLMANRSQAKADAVTTHYAEILRMQIVANASGRPGPEIETGEYVASWRVEFGGGGAGGALSATVTTDEPQANRLEFGFVGVDADGRMFNQPPFPHVAPAVQVVEGPFAESVAKGIIIP